MTVKVLNISQEDEVKKWDDFIIKYGQLYHHSHWARIIRSSYGFKPYYLYVEENGEIKSVFPLFRVTIPFLKDELVSLPHIEAGGIVNPQYHPYYFDYIYKQIRSRTIRIYQYKDPLDDFIANTSEVIMTFELPENKEEIIPRIKSKSERKHIRKVLEESYEITIGNDTDIIEQFYHIYQNKMKEFGTPSHTIRFIQTIANIYGDQCRVITIKDANHIVGAELHIFCDTFMNSLYLSVPREFLKREVGVLLNYKTIELAVQKGMKYLTFGRCSRQGKVYSYKSDLGAIPVPLYIYKFYLTQSGYVAQYVKTMKQTYSLASKIWSKLPSFFTNQFGPLIRKWVY